MAWRQAFQALLNSGKVISMAGGAAATGSYVFYKDETRYAKMSHAYAKGNILPPFTENSYETAYFPRPALEKTLREVLCPKFTNEYYLISGESGSGKTRTVVEVIRRLIATEGRHSRGAPVYVLSIQGRNFPETLARAVGFNFDEHISFQFFLDFVMRIHTFPQRDDHNRLIRVLDAVEKSAFAYMTRNGRPMVLVVDGANSLEQYMPGALRMLQEKAKLWADANIAKIVFITNDEETGSLLQKQSSNWSRAATPIIVGDLTNEEAIEYLLVSKFMENSDSTEEEDAMPLQVAERIVDLVGGRMHHLIVCKRSWVTGRPIGETVEDLMSREREKFVCVSRNPSLWNVIARLRQAPEKTLLLSKLIRETSEEAVTLLAKQDILRYGRRDGRGTTVQFQSKLTERAVEQLEMAYVREKSLAQGSTESHGGAGDGPGVGQARQDSGVHATKT